MNLLLSGQRFDNAFASVLNMDEPYFANFGEEPCTLLNEMCWGRIEALLPDVRASEGAPYVTSTGPVGWVDIGKNDVALYGDPEEDGGRLRRAWRNAWRANLAAGWAGGRFGPNHASIAYSAGWVSESPSYAPEGLMVCNANGNDATITVPADYHGGFVNLLFIGEPVGVVGCATVAVAAADGDPVLDTFSVADAMPFGHSRINHRIAIPALGDVSEVFIENQGGGRLAFAGWSIEALNRPLLFATLIPTPADWVSLHPGGTPRGEGEVQADDLYAALYNSYTTEVFAEFSPDGPCVTVNLDPVLNGTQHRELWSPDGIHLNAAGIPVAVAEVARTIAPFVAEAGLIGPREADHASLLAFMEGGGW